MGEGAKLEVGKLPSKGFGVRGQRAIEMELKRGSIPGKGEVS